ncbi:glycosyl transferase [Methanobrevibacter sp. DSM 116169]|uniref:glycosyl transferase n=1 Tax=Methanobrevibacter sp. DSM 116169 TaxID=3242727 RepID=UPI0038FCEC67
MGLGTDTEKETLQSLFKACLLELDKTKIEVTDLEFQNERINENSVIKNFEDEINNKQKEIDMIKSKAESEFASYNDLLQEKDEIIKTQDNKIFELNYITNSLDEIKEYFADQLKDFKKKELIDINEKLDHAKTIIAEKDVEIKSLNKELDEKNIDIIKLETTLDGKKSMISIKDELDKTKEEIYKKDNEINLLKESSIPKDKYFKLKQELFKKDDKIKRLEEVNEFFNDLESNSKKSKSLHRD